MEKIIIGKDIRWKNNRGEIVGYGFSNDDGTTSLVRCPECGRENYAMNVITGRCTWCPFNSNEQKN